MLIIKLNYFLIISTKYNNKKKSFFSCIFHLNNF